MQPDGSHTPDAEDLISWQPGKDAGKVPPPIPAKPLIIALVAGVFIITIKFTAYYLSGSVALKSDAFEGIVNLVAGTFALISIIIASRPADKNHPYGHGKIENFSAGFEGALISIAAFLIIYEAVTDLIYGVELNRLDLGIWLGAGGGLLNGIIGYYLLRTGRKVKSKTIEADGKHLLSDLVTTIALTTGLLLVQFTGWNLLDPALAILAALYLAWHGFELVKESWSALLDTEDPAVLRQIAELLNQNQRPEIITVHEVRTLRTGRYTHIDAHIVVPEYLTVDQAHDLVEEYEKNLLESGNLTGEFHSHIDPCRRAFCRSCRVENCHIRTAPVAQEALRRSGHTESSITRKELM